MSGQVRQMCTTASFQASEKTSSSNTGETWKDQETNHSTHWHIKKYQLHWSYSIMQYGEEGFPQMENKQIKEPENYLTYF